jgi:1,2-phenylacetyl-CoA epoxidase PaaB subunit
MIWTKSSYLHSHKESWNRDLFIPVLTKIYVIRILKRAKSFFRSPDV